MVINISINSFVKSWVILYSAEGCQNQIPHTDYEPTAEMMQLTDMNYMPLGCIFSLMPNTKIHLWKQSIDVITRHKKLDPPIYPTIQTLDVLIFRGNMVHAGSDYDIENIRIHAYADSPYISRTKNRTYYASKDDLLSKYIVPIK